MKPRRIKLDARGRPVKKSEPTQIQADLLAAIYAQGDTPYGISKKLGWYKHNTLRLLKRTDGGAIQRMQQIVDAAGLGVRFVKVKRKGAP